MQGYSKLEVWQLARELANQIYAQTRGFPSDELYGMRAQLQRAIVSVCANIAEGSRRGAWEFRHHLKIAEGSLAEVECLAILAADRRYVTDAIAAELVSKVAIIMGKLINLQRSLPTEPRSSAPH